MKVLHVCSEAYPLVKTGGLADVTAALPLAQCDLGMDAQILLPAYPGVRQMLPNVQTAIPIGDPMGFGEARLIRGRMPDSGVPVWLVDCPPLFKREGGPYADRAGVEWPDNAQRFALLGYAAALVAEAGAIVGWQPEVVHAHDWQAALAPAYLSFWQNRRCGTVFTIHNIQYQGRFAHPLLEVLRLPPHSFNLYGLELYGDLSFLKAGVYYSAKLTTVSPTYSQEIQTPAFGNGLEGLLDSREADLTAILNGVDYRLWDPGRDPWIVRQYGAENLENKAVNKTALQEELGLELRVGAPLFCLVGRFVEQKGYDLVLGALGQILECGGQLVALGTEDDPRLVEAFRGAAAAHPGRVVLAVGFNEPLTHRVLAGSDIFLAPSRFEPCGMAQMYGQRYGTLPIVRRTGGLVDTVTDLSDRENGTGFIFDWIESEDLGACIRRAVGLREDHVAWERARKRAMARDFGWENTARRYRDLYLSVTNRA
ncbi:MAG: glycogen synthase GlgA [Magnetococcales bacterium]|nr:glycogen synthase GlgA [Magnetococcales bacterium]MBF0156128.1 glycogen synthase GlgA [Magnetococcales bacterium]